MEPYLSYSWYSKWKSQKTGDAGHLFIGFTDTGKLFGSEILLSLSNCLMVFHLSLSLGQFRSKLESDTFEPQVWEEHLWKEVRTKLLSFLKWRQQNDDADIVQKFTDKAHEGMFKQQRIVRSYI
jgi:hypothetical protein